MRSLQNTRSIRRANVDISEIRGRSEDMLHARAEIVAIANGWIGAQDPEEALGGEHHGRIDGQMESSLEKIWEEFGVKKRIE